ncbi:MAG: hypothetical protein KME35_03265 [Aphanocapsa sp. GSE-SYN-MK-11-07L]|jgi:hypothetical protein|nr:hypothetical protein [Aphanocapsa sp. GSE-SYN-MK-11-07L]
MIHPVLPPRLYLLAPWDLPIQQQLSDVHRAKLQRSLKQFLKALEQTSYQEAVTTINQELANLDVRSVASVQLSSTQTPLKSWEIEDFDTYFEVSHVQTHEPAVCMVWSLMVTYQAFLVLKHQGSDFDLAQVELQKEGFRSYVFLLARVFSLNFE